MDFISNRILIGYGILLLLCSVGIRQLEGNEEKVSYLLLQITLYLVPLVCLTLTISYVHNARPFIELLLTQPLHRKSVYFGTYIGLCSAYSMLYLLSMGIPVIWSQPDIQGMLHAMNGTAFNWLFPGIAMFLAYRFRDRTKALLSSLLLWFFMSFLFDAVLLYVLYQYGNYPIESGILCALFMNPIALGRTSVILQTETVALLGASGAVFRHVFQESQAWLWLFLGLGCWIASVALLGYKSFKRLDW